MNKKNILNVSKSNTMVNVILENLHANPDDMLFTFLKDGEMPTEQLSNEQLYKAACSIASYFQELGIKKGDRVLLLYPAGLDFIKAFTACMLAGIIAVPASLPKKNRSIGRILGIISNAKPKLILSQSRVKNELTNIFLGCEAQHLPIIDTQLLSEERASDFKLVKSSPDAIAFLQYTSGSTGNPKGVIVTQENIVTNQRQIQHGYRTDQDSRMLSWLPAHHDMGLIGGILQPMFVGFHSYLMSPAAFVQKPARWLRAITRFAVTMSGGPNFGYDLCLNHITEENKSALDLRSWICAVSGAEKVRPETLDKFSSAFKTCGFERRSFYPAYGMAETTLFISGGDPTELPIVKHVSQDKLNGSIKETINTEREVRVIGCGKALAGEEIIIADPKNKSLCATETLGEIWVKGKNICRGYWENPEATQESFGAYINDVSNTHSSGPYFRTGDLGFLDESGELYVCGRLKELLILNGVNHHPQDIEHSAQKSHPALTLNGGAAFSVDKNGQEVLVIVNEVERKAWRDIDQNAVFKAIKRSISNEHELEVSAIVLIKPMSLMKTSSGKIRRLTIRQAFMDNTLNPLAEYHQDTKHEHNRSTAVTPNRTEEKEANAKAQTFSARKIKNWLIDQLSQETGLAPENIDADMALAEYGLTSLSILRITGALEEYLQRPLQSTLLYDYSNITLLAEYLSVNNDQNKPLSASGTPKIIDDLIAVIGIGCRFPGKVESPEDFWTLLANGENAITEVPTDRWQWDGQNKAIGFGGFVEKIKEFDASFFNISPKEAESLDPQQRLLLEVCWRAIEDSVQAPSQLKNSRTGVFVGLSSNDYSRLIEQNGDLGRYFATGNALSTAAGRISYVLGLKGPALAIDTACSSSLVAIHNARTELLMGNCDLALAGGVNLMLSPTTTHALNSANMLSIDARCATFDTSANGYVRGEGCGMVLLKRLADAKRDGDRIYGVIRGSALNQDGNSNGLTAPSGLAQQEVICAALANAKVNKNDIDYIEAHGTGTQLGDPIELNALQAALTDQGKLNKHVLVGSVKTNIGHLESAAGVAGLIKVLLSLHHKKIPPHLHFQKQTTHFDWRGIRVPTEISDWSASDKSYQQQPSRVAGISSFGFSGTNAHLVLEGYEDAAHTPEQNDSQIPSNGHRETPELLTLSAKTESSLLTLLKTLAKDVNGKYRSASLKSLSSNVNKADCQFNYRFATTVKSRDQLYKKLTSTTLHNVDIAPHKSEISLFFPGQGAQCLNMGRELYEKFPVYKTVLDQCEVIVKQSTQWSLLDQLFADNTEINRDKINQTAISQPVLFAVEYALFQLLRSFGLQPSALIGHSLGEYVAACAAGVFSLHNALTLVCLRGKLMQAQQPGSMLSVSASYELVSSLIKNIETLEIAAINGPNSQVISGPQEAIDQFDQRCKASEITTKRIATSHAFHSQMMAPMVEEYSAALTSVQFSMPKIPLISNISGTFADETICTAEYWCKHITAPVKFFAGVKSLSHEAGSIFLECGPSPILIALAKEGLRYESTTSRSVRDEKVQTVSAPTFIPTLRGVKRSETLCLFNALAELYRQGCELDLHSLTAESLNIFPVIHQPFQRKPHWIKRRIVVANQLRTANTTDSHPLIGKRLSLPMSKEIRFAASLHAKAPAYMNDHRLYGVVISPAASHISSILTSAGHISEHKQFLLHDVSFEQAMVLKEESEIEVHIIYQPLESNIYEWSLASVVEDQHEALIHARGHAVLGGFTQDSGMSMTFEASATVKLRCNKYSEGSDFYQKMWDGGYHLGSSFKWLSKIYQGKDEAGAELCFPTLLDNVQDYAVHPGLLDSCLQMVSLCCERVLDLQGGEFLYVPTKLAKMFFYRPIVAGEKLWCHSQALAAQISSTCLAANISLFDEAGLPVLILEGFEARRASRELLLTNIEKEEPSSDWLYDIAWRVEQHSGYWLPPDYIPSPDQIAKELGNAWQKHLEQPAMLAYPAVLMQLEQNSLLYIIDAFLTLGWQYPSGSILTAESTVQDLAINPSFTRLVHRLLSILAEERYLDLQLEQFIVRREIDANVDSGKQQSVFNTDGPEVNSAEFVLLDRCGSKLAEALRGEEEARELLFPGGDTSTATQLYTYSPGAKALNTLIMQTVSAAVAKLPANRRLRILEIGAGTGGTTAHLLPLLDPTMTEYVFTDMSNLFLSQAQEKFDQYPFVRYQLLDIEQSPLQQDFNQYDIVIAANVLHATINIKQTLRHIHKLLATNGVIIMLEGTTRLRWMDLTFGLTEGWWRYQDTDTRPNHPLMNATQWHQVLREVDFIDPQTLTELSSKSEQMQEQSVIIAQRGSIKYFQKHWLICADQQGIAQQLAESLCKLGDLCSIIQFAPADRALATPLTPGIEIFVLNNNEPDNFASALLQVEQIQGCEVHEVLQLQGLDAPDTDNVDSERIIDFVQQLTCGTLAIIKTLANQVDKHPRKLRLVSMNAVSIQGEPCQGIAASPLWGLGRTLVLEYPELRCQRVDLEKDKPFNSAKDLLSLLHVNSTEPEIVLRKGLMHYSRLQQMQNRYELGNFNINKAGSYLITGGLSGIGLLCAEWLVAKGARTLILLGRRRATPEAQEQIDYWQQTGVSVGVYQADVSDFAHLQSLADTQWQQHEPIAGIIHSAGVLDDASLMKQSWDKFARVMKPKVKGAWNLHRLTLHYQLDFFVLFSSAASLLGSPGQANHSAANSFMDALAAHRKSMNLPALSINWGAWSDIGAAERHQAEKHLSNHGVAWIPPNKGIDLLENILSQQETQPQVGVVPFDWPRFEVQLKEMGYPPFYTDLVKYHFGSKRAQLEKPDNHDWIAKVNEANTHSRLAMLTAFVVDKALDALGLDLDYELDICRPIDELGFDSLMAMDLVSDFNQQLGIKMPSSKLLQNPSVEHLAVICLELMIQAKVLTSIDDTANTNPTTQSSVSRWIVRHTPKSHTNEDQSKLRLFCLHYLGGGASVFREWSDHLGPDIEVCAIQLPGREERIDEQPFDRMEPLIETLLEKVQPLLDKPFAIYGHSMGSLIGFELIRAIRERCKCDPLHFWASAYYAPHCESPFQKVGHWQDQDILDTLPRLIEAPKRILENKAFVNTMLPTIRGDIGIVSTYTYVPSKPLNCPITAMGGDKDKEVFAKDIAKWKTHTNQIFTQVTFSGGHIFVNDNKHELLEHISQALLDTQNIVATETE